MRSTCVTKHVESTLLRACTGLDQRRALPVLRSTLSREPLHTSIAFLSHQVRLNIPRMAETNGVKAGAAGEHSVVLVLDYGSQYTQLIARRIRDIGMFSVLLPGDVNMVSLRSQAHFLAALHGPDPFRTVHLCNSIVVFRSASRGHTPA